MEISRTVSQVRAEDTVWNGRRWVRVTDTAHVGSKHLVRFTTGWVAYTADKTFRVAV